MCERFLTLPFTDDLGHHGILIKILDTTIVLMGDPVARGVYGADQVSLLIVEKGCHPLEPPQSSI